jgi:uncharacterized protein YhaN
MHMPIREIRRYAALRGRGINGVNKQRKILEDHRSALNEEITKLNDALALLTAHIEAFEAGEPQVHLFPAHPDPEENRVRHELSQPTRKLRSVRIVASVLAERSYGQRSNK